MDITICIKGKKFDKDSSDAIAEYTKRMSVFCNVNVKFYKKYKDYPVQGNSHSIGFLVKAGKSTPSSPELATQISSLQTKGYSSIYYYLVDTMDEEATAAGLTLFDTLSLSCFQMSLPTTAIVLTEQLYRAFTILNNITYHK